MTINHFKIKFTLIEKNLSIRLYQIIINYVTYNNTMREKYGF